MEDDGAPPTTSQNDDVFYDALEEFPDQPDHSPSSSPADSKPTTSSQLRLRHSRRPLSGDDSKASSALDSDSRPTSFRARKFRLRRNLKPPEPFEPVNAPTDLKDHDDEGSTVTSAANDDRAAGDTADSAAAVQLLGDSSSSSFNILVFIAGFIIKAIGLQINLLISIVTFPAWIIYNSYMFFIDPFQIVRQIRHHMVSNLFNLSSSAAGWVSPVLGEWLKDKDSVWKVALRFGWGLLWAVYVGFVMCGLLVSSVVFTGVLMRRIVAEPLQMKEVLNFDYTRHSPVAYVPVATCAGVYCGEDCGEKVQDGSIFQWRVIPPGHKLGAALKFVLPESEYNRNLGIFQVRVEFLSAEGKTLASSSHPCMLHFKSEPIRLLLTLIKIAPLISGFYSEAQTLNLKFRGFVEGDVPTACLKVTIEQRAEYNPGAGIPEIYEASMTLESELPLFRRFIWNWKRTIFVWMTMLMFTMEMLFALVCCRPLVIPRARPRAASVRRISAQTQSSIS